MDDLIEKLTRYYRMSMFKNIEAKHQLYEEIRELENELQVEHTHFNGVLEISKILYKEVI